MASIMGGGDQNGGEGQEIDISLAIDRMKKGDIALRISGWSKIGNRRINSGQMKELCEAIRQNKNLIKIEINSIIFDSVTMELFCDAIRQAPQLRELSLPYNNITLVQLQHLVKILPALSIPVLDLRGNPLEDGGVLAIAAILPKTKIQTVYLRDTVGTTPKPGMDPGVRRRIQRRTYDHMKAETHTAILEAIKLRPEIRISSNDPSLNVKLEAMQPKFAQDEIESAAKIEVALAVLREMGLDQPFRSVLPQYMAGQGAAGDGAPKVEERREHKKEPLAADQNVPLPAYAASVERKKEAEAPKKEEPKKAKAGPNPEKEKPKKAKAGPKPKKEKPKKAEAAPKPKKEKPKKEEAPKKAKPPKGGPGPKPKRKKWQ